VKHVPDRIGKRAANVDVAIAHQGFKVSRFQGFKDRKFHVLELAIVVVIEPCADDFLGKQTP